MFVKFLCALIYCLTRCHVLRSWPEVNQIIMLREDRVLWFPINWLPYVNSGETPFNFLFISFPPLLYLIRWGNRNTVGCDRRHTRCPVVYSNLSHSFSALFICVFALDQYIQYLICSCVFREESLKLELNQACINVSGWSGTDNVAVVWYALKPLGYQDTPVIFSATDLLHRAAILLQSLTQKLGSR